MVEAQQGSTWFAPAVLGAVIAALGYVAKLLIESLTDYRNRKRERKSQLVQLRSLLNVTRVSFAIQNEHAARLLALLKQRKSQLDFSGGFESVFSEEFDTFTAEEKELHSIIRGITIHSLRPANSAIRSWLREDSYFKGQPAGQTLRGSLAAELGNLETHLLLWESKYQVWIPENPKHSLVYLADEKNHGTGFPGNIDSLVEESLKGG
jgi:hypothetical protein